MQNDILNNINKAAIGQSGNGVSNSRNETGWRNMADISNMNGGRLDLGRPMEITHTAIGTTPRTMEPKYAFEYMEANGVFSSFYAETAPADTENLVD